MGQFFRCFFRAIANQVSPQADVQWKAGRIQVLRDNGDDLFPHTDGCPQLKTHCWLQWVLVQQHHEYITVSQRGFKRVAQWLTGLNIELVKPDADSPLQLSYFGLADPAAFGLAARKLNWASPDSGWIAISVNHMVGIQNDPGPAAWLWHLQPRVKIGKSIWLYYLEK